MDYLAVVAVIEQGRDNKYRVKHLYERLFSTHQVYQTLRVVEYRPGIVPAVTFSKGVTPLQRRERRLELAVLITTTHQLAFLIKYIPIVHGTFRKEFLLLLRTVQFFCHAVDAPVIISILQSTGSVLVDFHIVGNITKLVVILIAEATRGRNLGMDILCTVDETFVQCLHVLHLHAFQIGICQHGSRVVANHTATVTRTCPFGKETAFLIGVDKAFLNLPVHRRIHQVEEWEKTAESVPETGIRIHIAGQHLPIVGTVMNRISRLIQFIECTREQQGTIQT